MRPSAAVSLLRWAQAVTRAAAAAAAATAAAARAVSSNVRRVAWADEASDGLPPPPPPLQQQPQPSSSFGRGHPFHVEPSLLRPSVFERPPVPDRRSAARALAEARRQAAAATDYPAFAAAAALARGGAPGGGDADADAASAAAEYPRMGMAAPPVRADAAHKADVDPTRLDGAPPPPRMGRRGAVRARRRAVGRPCGPGGLCGHARRRERRTPPTERRWLHGAARCRGGRVVYYPGVQQGWRRCSAVGGVARWAEGRS